MYVPLPSAVSSLLSMLGLAACGSGSSDPQEGGEPLSSVTIEGDQGSEPKVTFDGRLDGSKDETEVLVEGDGEEVAEGDTVKANWWIGNGFTEKKAQSTWTKDGAPAVGGDVRGHPAVPARDRRRQPGRRPRRAAHQRRGGLR